ncbi:dihydrodipicolinate synthase family protein [Mycobacterium sp. AMU20-3851]|uniref:dihydrodipicolinate synthase family protein n=1 Tax=Mycobacterium sp. AMU20-3851 TaxID=3122055 RepID=UPI0037552C67
MGLFGVEGTWHGVIAAPMTPFTSNLASVNHVRYAEQVDFLIRTGVPALAPALHIGESPSLTDAERVALVSATLETAEGRVPVIANVSSSSTLEAVRLAELAQEAGAAAVIVASPYYWRPTGSALVAHLTTIANSVDLQVIPYLYPGDLSIDSFADLLDSVSGVAAVKSGDFDLQVLTEMCRVASSIRSDFSVLAGVEYPLAMASVGGAGSFSALGVVAPRLVSELSAAVVRGDIAAALPLQHKASELWLLLRANYPARVKAAAAIMGRDLGPTRPPVCALDSDQVATLAGRLEQIGLVESEPHGWLVPTIGDGSHSGE